MMRTFKVALGLILVGFLLYSVVNYYPYIFSKSVDGVLVSVEKIQLNVALMQNTGADNTVNPQLFSFAVAIRTDDGEIITASTEDRQWAASLAGRCVTAQFYPYAPWKLAKGGTYFNARLDRQYECPDRAAAARKSAEAISGFATPTPSATPPGQSLDMSDPTPAPAATPNTL